MRARDLARYCREIGWQDAPLLEVAAPPPSEPLPESGDLDSLAREATSCTRCRLSEQRRNVVVGEGNPHARVMFVGEGPGAEEDRTGRPFVGQAGLLLDAMIFALGLERRQVYIANVVKCRPPGNRDPQDDEVAACAPFLDRQIALIRPQVIVALGKPAARRLTGSAAPIGALCGRWSSYLGVPVLPTFHPAYLLRTPLAKREVWQDLKVVRARLEALASATGESAPGSSSHP
jgi:DNA polymerase